MFMVEPGFESVSALTTLDGKTRAFVHPSEGYLFARSSKHWSFPPFRRNR
jgi:hypothetical protein